LASRLFLSGSWLIIDEFAARTCDKPNIEFYHVDLRADRFQWREQDRPNEQMPAFQKYV
jgi:hypothetical protein